jgi:hypothetical protein
MAVDKANHFRVLLRVHTTMVSGLFAIIVAVVSTGLFVQLAFHFSFSHLQSAPAPSSDSIYSKLSSHIWGV